MGYYEEVCVTYGRQARDLLKYWRTVNVKLARQASRRIFLLKCRKSGVLPRHVLSIGGGLHDLVVGETPFHNELDSALRRFRKTILNLEIKATVYRINYLTTEKALCIEKVMTLLPDGLFREYISWMNGLREVEFFKRKYALDKKWENLRKTQGKGFFDSFSGELSVTNLTDIQVPADCLQLLSLGEKFAVETHSKRDMPIHDIIGDLEKILSCVPIKDADVIRSDCVNVIKNHSYKVRNAPNQCIRQGRDIGGVFSKTKRFLKDHPDVMVCKSDKGGNTVIMKKSDYDAKMAELLGDDDTYSHMTRDPSSTYRKKVNALVDDMVCVGCISRSEASRLKSFNGVSPRVYGLPKLHKQGIPLRPIVSFINSPTYELSKMVEVALKPIVDGCEYNVKNSFQFKSQLENITLDINHVMMSLDVRSLFTNIPLDVAFQLISKQWTKFGPSSGIPKELFLRILELVCDARYFVHGGQMYIQKFGLPMGSPISPILANIVMVELLMTSLAQLGDNVKFIRLYVDDLFLIVRKGKEQAVLTMFNSYHDRLKFTMESEVGGKLPFLDIKVIRGPDGSLLTDWYTKPTSSGRILHYQSSHVMRQKFNCITNLVRRVIDVSSDCFLSANKRRVIDLLKKNGYPPGLVSRFWYRYIRRLQAPNRSCNEVVSPKKFFRFPYVEGLSNGIGRILKAASPDVSLAYYSKCRVGSLFSKLKDDVPTALQSNVVYSIKCLQCTGCYYGETSRFVKERSYQHLYSVNTKKVTSTALAAHSVREGHSFDFPGISIVAKEPDDHKRKTLEMLFIKKDPSAINYRSDIDNLSAVYCGILDV